MMNEPSPVDSMREAVFTVSPNRQYLGIACPTTPVVYAIQSHSFTIHKMPNRSHNAAVTIISLSQR